MRIEKLSFAIGLSVFYEIKVALNSALILTNHR